MSKKTEENKELANVNSAVANVTGMTDDRPDWMNADSGRGSENVGRDELTIPRIEVCQSLSKCRKRGDPAYIDGVSEGDLYNNLTRENFGPAITIVPVAFGKEYVLWRDQALGGGFGGAFDSEEAAEEVRLAQEKPDEWEACLTHQHFVLVVKEDGTVEEAVISMSKSKLKASRNLNSQIRLVGGDRWCRAFRMQGLPDQNKQGQDYYNIAFRPVGWISKELYARAEKLYESVATGTAKVDRSGDSDTAPEAEEF